MTPYLQAVHAQYGQEVIDWLEILRVDVGRMLPPDVEQRMRIEGLIKFKYRDAEAYLTRRGRRAARMIAEHKARPNQATSQERSDG